MMPGMCNVCTSTIVRWAADARYNDAPKEEWAELYKIANRVRPGSHRHLDLAKPPKDYVMLAVSIGTYDQLLDELRARS